MGYRTEAKGDEVVVLQQSKVESKEELIEHLLTRYDEAGRKTIKAFWRWLGGMAGEPYPVEDKLQELQIWLALPEKQVIARIKEQWEKLKVFMKKHTAPDYEMVEGKRFIAHMAGLHRSPEEEIEGYLSAYGEDKEIVLRYIEKSEKQMGKKLSPEAVLHLLRGFSRYKPEKLIRGMKKELGDEVS